MTTPSGNDNPPTIRSVAEHSSLRLAGGLLVGGFLLNLVVTLFHPSGDEDNHRIIFAKYADSDAWIAIHLGQFIAVLIALAGFVVLSRFLTLGVEGSLLSRFAVGATIATAAAFAILQGMDGVALKQAVDAWTDAFGAQKAIRFDDAETLRWLEWGFQSYFRVLLGMTFALFGAAILVTRRAAAWLGWIAAFAGAVSVAIGIDVGYSGLESAFQDAAAIAFVVAAVVFAVGLILTGARGRDPLAARA
jgi:hypothetical protein